MIEEKGERGAFVVRGGDELETECESLGEGEGFGGFEVWGPVLEELAFRCVNDTNMNMNMKVNVRERRRKGRRECI